MFCKDAGLPFVTRFRVTDEMIFVATYKNWQEQPHSVGERCEQH